MIADTAALAAVSAPLGALMEAVILIDGQDRIVYANPAACRITGYTMEQLIGADAYGSMPPEARAALQRAITQHEASQPPGTLMRGAFVMTRADGEDYEAEFTAVGLVLEANTYTVVIFRDVTETGHLARRVEALSEIASQVAIAEPLETTLDKLAKSVVRATGTVACAVVLLDHHGEFRMWGAYGFPCDADTAAGWAEAMRRGASMPYCDSVRNLRWMVYENARTALLNNPAYEPLYPVLRQLTWDTTISVPMVYRGRALGALMVFYPRGKNPGQAQIAFLTAVAGQAAVAVENSRLFTEAKEKAILEERQRIARELHDSVSQALYGIALGARTARTLLDRAPADAAQPLEYVLSLADAGLAEMRALIFELRPETLESEGLLGALARQIDSLRTRHGLDIRTEWSEEPEVPIEVKETVYRIAQEALNNIVKHAHARRVDLRIADGGDELALEIGDDGVGFPLEEAPGHLGLRSMRERAVRLGGTLLVESAPDRGTRIRASIPRSTGSSGAYEFPLRP
ncbi:MAG: histidine kinase [Armatimonadota bacterium]|nr:histidine kinase [Armatimonadota bacterium]